MKALGAFAVSSFVALFAGAVCAETTKRDVYYGRVYVSDGDTLHMGADRLRIWGIDAPETDQVCIRDQEPLMCGELAKEALSGLIGRSSVRCFYKDWNEGRLGMYPPRAVVRCTVRGVDLGDWMASRGMAVPNYALAYMNTGRLACERQIGLWSGAWADPSDWRRRRFMAPKGFGAQSGTSCRQAFQRVRARMERYSRHTRSG